MWVSSFHIIRTGSGAHSTDRSKFNEDTLPIAKRQSGEADRSPPISAHLRLHGVVPNQSGTRKRIKPRFEIVPFVVMHRLACNIILLK
jgi:hypothetical protein